MAGCPRTNNANKMCMNNFGPLEHFECSYNCDRIQFITASHLYQTFRLHKFPSLKLTRCSPQILAQGPSPERIINPSAPRISGRLKSAANKVIGTHLALVYLIWLLLHKDIRSIRTVGRGRIISLRAISGYLVMGELIHCSGMVSPGRRIRNTDYFIGVWFGSRLHTTVRETVIWKCLMAALNETSYWSFAIRESID